MKVVQQTILFLSCYPKIFFKHERKYETKMLLKDLPNLLGLNFCPAVCSQLLCHYIFTTLYTDIAILKYDQTRVLKEQTSNNSFMVFKQKENMAAATKTR